MDFATEIRQGIPQDLPTPPKDDPAISRAPRRAMLLSPSERRLALANALRYFPPELHAELAPEFLAEFEATGRIYMFRYRPHHEMRARAISEYPARCQHPQ